MTPKSRSGSPSRVATPDAIPPLSRFTDPRGPYLLPLLLLLAARAFACAQIPFASEDAYITFRYAKNLVVNHQLVYNPGERVLGFSSPIWTLWCALGLALRLDPVAWTRGTCVLADAGALLLLGRAVERVGGRRAATCFTFFFAVWPYLSFLSTSGMENGPMVLAIAAAATLAPRGGVAGGLALGLLGLWRPEGLAAAAVLAPSARGRSRWISLGIVAAGVAALTVAYGSPVPQSLLAKSRIYGTPGPWAGRHWWTWAVPVLFGSGPPVLEGTHLFPLAVLTAPAFAIGATTLARRRNEPAFWAAAAGVAVWLGYAVLGVAWFWWYFAVPLAACALVASVGWPRVVGSRGVLVGCALYVASAWTVAHPLAVARAQNEAFGFGATSDFLAARARPGEKVLLEPIGMIGWRNPLVVIDETGLVSPRVTRRRLEGPGWYEDVVANDRPEWIVVRRRVRESGEAFAGIGAPFRSPVSRDSTFAGYTLETIVDERAGPGALLVFRRR